MTFAVLIYRIEKGARVNPSQERWKVERLRECKVMLALIGPDRATTRRDQTAPQVGSRREARS